MTTDDNQSIRKHLWDMLGGIRFAMFTTRGPDGGLRSRPLTTQNDKNDSGFQLCFFIGADSEVAADVAADASVHVGYADPGKDQYISIGGQAEVRHDPARQAALFSPMAKSWFPGGADDPNLRLLTVRIDSAEYWDVTDSKMVQLYKMAKAAISGDPPKDMGEHRELKG